MRDGRYANSKAAYDAQGPVLALTSNAGFWGERRLQPTCSRCRAAPWRFGA